MAKHSNKKIALLFAVIGCFAFFTLALALQTSWPDSPMKTKVDNDTNLGQFIRYLYEWGIALGGVATFIAFVIAGFQYITSIGNPQTMKDAIDRIKSAMFGLVLLLSAYVLLNTINPELVNFRLDPFNPEAVNDFFNYCEEGKTGCPDGQECVPLGDKFICWPKQSQGAICKDAIIYPNVDFKPENTETVINLNELIEGVDDMPRSIRARFAKDKEGKECKKDKGCFCDERTAPDPMDKTKTVDAGDKNGCGCILRLYASNKGWIWKKCGDMIADVPAYDENLGEFADKDVYCIELMAPGSSPE